MALLQLIDRKNPSNKTYSYLPLSTQISPSIGNNISIASYPANILGTNGINFLLSVQLEPLKISNIFSFSSDETDLIETTDSLQAQPGSSGGAVLDSTGNVIGVVAITVAGDSPFAKHARAITISEINKTIQGDTGMTLSSILSSDLTGITQQFNSNKASLVSMLLGV